MRASYRKEYFNFSKQHAMTYIVYLICCFGVTDRTDTNYTEHLYPILVKQYFQLINYSIDY